MGSMMPRISQKENLNMASMRWKDVNFAAKVEGRVRCHTCSLLCCDAKHYLSHKCGPKVSLTVVRQSKQ